MCTRVCVCVFVFLCVCVTLYNMCRTLCLTVHEVSLSIIFIFMLVNFIAYLMFGTNVLLRESVCSEVLYIKDNFSYTTYTQSDRQEGHGPARQSEANRQTYIPPEIDIHVYIYVCVCVCVCVRARARLDT